MPTWQSGVKSESLSHLGEDEDEERGRKGGDKEAKEEAEGTLNRKLTKKEEGHFSTAGRVADPESVAFDTIDSPKGPTTTQPTQTRMNTISIRMQATDRLHGR